MSCNYSNIETKIKSYQFSLNIETLLVVVVCYLLESLEVVLLLLQLVLGHLVVGHELGVDLLGRAPVLCNT